MDVDGGEKGKVQLLTCQMKLITFFALSLQILLIVVTDGKDPKDSKDCQEENFIWDCITLQEKFQGNRNNVEESCQLLLEVSTCVDNSYERCKVRKPLNFIKEIDKICSADCIKSRRKCDDVKSNKEYNQCTKEALGKCHGNYRVFKTFSPFGRRKGLNIDEEDKDDDDKCDDLVSNCKTQKYDDKKSLSHNVKADCSKLDKLVSCLEESMKSPKCKNSHQKFYVKSMKSMKLSICSDPCQKTRRRCESLQNVCHWWDCTNDALEECKGRNKRFTFHIKAILGELCETRDENHNKQKKPSDNDEL
ncbi:DgyrCDS8019 [Dimorphilus gyrociliatus]|uniref:DgyrCDS8019 n=1 Tax=Dimorphilus gyrociliatus TaxID=2664684 RepID=A0A7I8VSY3_9ANNE|nr:DgyrCDS8019 [Dimorphilus gyrociliatus]